MSGADRVRTLKCNFVAEPDALFTRVLPIAVLEFLMPLRTLVNIRSESTPKSHQKSPKYLQIGRFRSPACQPKDSLSEHQSFRRLCRPQEIVAILHGSGDKSFDCIQWRLRGPQAGDDDRDLEGSSLRYEKPYVGSLRQRHETLRLNRAEQQQRGTTTGIFSMQQSSSFLSYYAYVLVFFFLCFFCFKILDL